MAVIDNRLTEVGDVLVIQTEIPLVGIIALLGFTDLTTGEVPGSREFDKKFRYSFDGGVNWSDFVDLTTSNILEIPIQDTDLFILEYLYIRTGTDSSGELTVEAVQLNSQTILGTSDDVYGNSIFKEFYNSYSICTLAWSINVLEKLYRDGIVPKYIKRGKRNDTREDQDYLDFWFTVSLFYSYYVCLAREFKDFYTNSDLLREFLIERNMFMCNDIQMADMLYIMRMYHSEMSHRGTEQIFLKKGVSSYEDEDNSFSESFSQSLSGSFSHSYSSVDPFFYRQVDGELLRLICYSLCDEFIWGLGRAEHTSWNMGNGSPCYRGLMPQHQFSKGYEITEDVIDLSVYPLIEDQLISIAADGDKYVMDIDVPVLGPFPAGIGQLTNQDIDKMFVVEPNMSYQLTFQIKIGPKLDKIMNIGFSMVDQFENNIIPTSSVTGTSTNYAIQAEALSRSDVYYNIRVILWAANQGNAWDPAEIYEKERIVEHSGNYYVSEKVTNFGITPGTTSDWRLVDTEGLVSIGQPSIKAGENLKMSSNVCKVMPIIHSSVPANPASIRIHNLKFKPLHFEYSHYFINVKNFVHIFMEQNNGRYTNEEVEEIMRRYLFPYNTSFRNTYL